MVAELGGAELISWMLALYEMGSIISGASVLAAIRFGVRLPMTFAAVLFGLGCATSADAPSMWMVLGEPLMQGLGGGMLSSMSYVAIALFFPRRLAALAIGAFPALWGLAAFSGPRSGACSRNSACGAADLVLRAPGVGAGGVDLPLCPRPSNPEPGATGLRLSGKTPRRPVARDSPDLLRRDRISARAHGRPCGLRCRLPRAVLPPGRREGAHRLSPDPLYPSTIRRRRHDHGAHVQRRNRRHRDLRADADHAHARRSALTAGYILAGAAIGWTIVALIVANAPERHDGDLIICGILIVAATIPALVYAVPNGPVWLIAAITAIQGGGNGLSWAFILRRAGTFAPPGETERIAAALPPSTDRLCRRCGLPRHRRQ